MITVIRSLSSIISLRALCSICLFCANKHVNASSSYPQIIVRRYINRNYDQRKPVLFWETYSLLFSKPFWNQGNSDEYLFDIRILQFRTFWIQKIVYRWVNVIRCDVFLVNYQESDEKFQILEQIRLKSQEKDATIFQCIADDLSILH